VKTVFVLQSFTVYSLSNIHTLYGIFGTPEHARLYAKKYMKLDFDGKWDEFFDAKSGLFTFSLRRNKDGIDTTYQIDEYLLNGAVEGS
jgi:hypothetical protein